MSRTLHTIVADPARLDRVVQALTGLSRSGVRGLLDHQCVRVNGSPSATAQALLAIGDVVEVQCDAHTRRREKPAIKDDPAYRILFEDEHMLVVNKAAHVLTVPTPRGKGKTLIEALQRHVDRALRGKARRQLHVVHRLDLGVSGVMIVARTARAASILRAQFASHKPQREYIAIVNGVVEPRRGTFRSHLATDGALNRYSTNDPRNGELAVTHYETLSNARGATVARVRLETGRRNQIRVHFAEAGHPVLGDPRYPRETQAPPRHDSNRNLANAAVSPLTSAHPKWKARRMALHARSLMFEHPATGELMRFETELPVEFAPFTGDVPPRRAAPERARNDSRERR